MQQELAYASYLNVHTAILPPPRNREHVASYARIVNAMLNSVPYMQFAVRLPIYDPATIHLPQDASKRDSKPGVSRKLLDDQSSIATWEMWDAIRTICDYSPRLVIGAFVDSGACVAY